LLLVDIGLIEESLLVVGVMMRVLSDPELIDGLLDVRSTTRELLFEGGEYSDDSFAGCLLRKLRKPGSNVSRCRGASDDEGTAETGSEDITTDGIHIPPWDSSV
jgi:hypothetical protein